MFHLGEETGGGYLQEDAGGLRGWPELRFRDCAERGRPTDTLFLSNIGLVIGQVTESLNNYNKKRN